MHRRAALLVLLAAAAARAQGAAADLVWDAPAGCPDARAVRADVAELVRGAWANPVRARARVTRVGADAEPAQWRLDLVTTTAAGERRRELHAATCTELAAAAATVLAIESGGAPRAADRAVAEATAGRAAADQAAAQPTAERDAPEGTAKPDAPEGIAKPDAPEGTAKPDAPEHRFAAGASFASATGAIGTLALGAGLHAAWLPGRERLELSAAYFPSSRVARGDIGGAFDLLVAGVAACHAFGSGALALGPCLGAEAGRIGASGRGAAVATSTSRAGVWLAGTGGARVTLDLGRFALRGEAVAVVPVVRDSFVILGVDEVYRPAVISARFAVGVEAHFP